MKKYHRFCTQTDRNFFQKMFIIQERCQIGSPWQNGKKFDIYETFSWRLYYRRLSQNDLKCFKNRLGKCGFADQKFFFFFPIRNPERFFSSVKKTIVLYLVKKFKTFMMIFTSGRRRLFFKKTILNISFTDNPFNTEFASKALREHKMLKYLYM